MINLVQAERNLCSSMNLIILSWVAFDEAPKNHLFLFLSFLFYLI